MPSYFVRATTEFNKLITDDAALPVRILVFVVMTVFMASGVSYAFGYLFKQLLKKLRWFGSRSQLACSQDRSSCVANMGIFSMIT